MEKLRYPTLKAAAQAALDVQNACNLSGVAMAFADIMRTLCEFVPGTDARNTHPIAQVFLDKMNQLAGVQSYDVPMSAAYRAVHELAEGLQ